MEEKTDIDRMKRLTRAKKVFFFVLTLFVLFIVFTFGNYTGQKGIYIGVGSKGLFNTEVGKPSGVDFSIFWEAWNKMKDKSVATTDDQKMEQGAISGMLSSLNDPYTVYFTKDENQRFHEDIQGSFEGIGVELVQKDSVPTVVSPLSDSPAEKAGIKAGDIISEVDGAKTSDIGFEETINRIRGADGTKVKLTIVRDGVTDPLVIEVTRAKIVIKSVEWDTKNVSGKKIFYIKMSQFGDDTDGLFNNAIEEAVKINPDGIILDLRNNPGGYLETAVSVASDFIKDGIVVSEKGKSNQDYKASGSAKLQDYKLVVLTNGGSASAAEILAGALRDRKSNKLIGEKTFGKGSVQELIELTDGSAVKITVAKWYTPNGTQINGAGLEPDIKIADDEKTTADEQLERAEQFLLQGK